MKGSGNLTVLKYISYDRFYEKCKAISSYARENKKWQTCAFRHFAFLKSTCPRKRVPQFLRNIKRCNLRRFNLFTERHEKLMYKIPKINRILQMERQYFCVFCISKFPYWLMTVTGENATIVAFHFCQIN